MKTMDSLKAERDACEERCTLLEALLRELVSDDDAFIHGDRCWFCGGEGWDGVFHHESKCAIVRARAALSQ